MRFTAHERVIDLLVGQQLYTSADAALRELVQNAEDACDLERITEPAFEARIIVRYSPSANWVEVADNGLGMDKDAIDKGFAAVGAPKTDVAHIRTLLQHDPRTRQVAIFGIGVLSCFGVASSILVRTKMDGNDGLAFRINNYHDDFIPDANVPFDRGTTVRLDLKPGGPMTAEQTARVIERYTRHAPYVELEDVDTGMRRPVLEQWSLPQGPEAASVTAAGVREGLIALDPSWDAPQATLRSGMVMCNGGFLVTERETGLLPAQAIGYAGELDIEPGGLTILLNREGFKRDEKWEMLSRNLAPIYNQLLRSKIAIWERQLSEKPRQSEEFAIDRAILLLTRGPPASMLEPDVGQRVQRLLPLALRVRLWGADDTITLASFIDRAQPRGVAYFVREGQGGRAFQHAVSEGSGTIQITEVAETTNLRATHLRAKGEFVVQCKQRVYSIEMAGQTQNVSWHEADVLGQELPRLGIRWVAVEDASREEVQLGAARESELLSGLLGLGSQLSFAVLDSSSQRVIRDFAGRYLNCANPEIRELLRALPDAVGNPVRQALLQAYIDLESFSFSQARERIKSLLMDPDLPEKAQLATGELTREYLRARLEALIEEPNTTA